jgi:hypothetical protein
LVPRLPRLRVPGDRLADTAFSVPLVLQRHVEQLRGTGRPCLILRHRTFGPFTAVDGATVAPALDARPPGMSNQPVTLD